MSPTTKQKITATQPDLSLGSLRAAGIEVSLSASEVKEMLFSDDLANDPRKAFKLIERVVEKTAAQLTPGVAHDQNIEALQIASAIRDYVEKLVLPAENHRERAHATRCKNLAQRLENATGIDIKDAPLRPPPAPDTTEPSPTLGSLRAAGIDISLSPSEVRETLFSKEIANDPRKALQLIKEVVRATANQITPEANEIKLVEALGIAYAIREYVDDLVLPAKNHRERAHATKCKNLAQHLENALPPAQNVSLQSENLITQEQTAGQAILNNMYRFPDLCFREETLAALPNHEPTQEQFIEQGGIEDFAKRIDAMDPSERIESIAKAADFLLCVIGTGFQVRQGGWIGDNSNPDAQSPGLEMPDFPPTLNWYPIEPGYSTVLTIAGMGEYFGDIEPSEYWQPKFRECEPVRLNASFTELAFNILQSMARRELDSGKIERNDTDEITNLKNKAYAEIALLKLAKLYPGSVPIYCRDLIAELENGLEVRNKTNYRASKSSSSPVTVIESTKPQLVSQSRAPLNLETHESRAPLNLETHGSAYLDHLLKLIEERNVREGQRRREAERVPVRAESPSYAGYKLGDLFVTEDDGHLELRVLTSISFRRYGDPLLIGLELCGDSEYSFESDKAFYADDVRRFNPEKHRFPKLQMEWATAKSRAVSKS